ncbi:LysR family transcriptional regulator [Paraburkholderia elongata]|uniref:LysR family transcriptional regulator n=1 Tax=Paraburkholderia elongata TaxID=2675747 RepID=A0A972SNU0_9BURK|nr:LysR family transcriptional regulator [Paraburkholderia elongata]NPT61634.1 LysR family transcriptional regulator [Paraburkholderia elongata]
MDKHVAMKVYVQIVETGGFAKAGEVLRTSATQVTRTVQALERELGVKLLNRNTRRISITDAGASYYERCVRVLQEIENMEADLQGSKAGKKGIVRISVPALVAKETVVPALPKFFAAYPDIKLEISIADHHADLVEEGLDCAVHVGAVNDLGLVAKRIGFYQLITCASPGYLEKYGEPSSLESLREHVGVGYAMKTGRIREWEFVVEGESRSSPLKSIIVVNDADTYVACGLARLGLIQASSFMLEPHLRAGRLYEVLTQFPSNPRPVSILYAPNRNRPKRVGLFIDWLMELYPNR